MTTRAAPDQLPDTLPEERLRQLADFARSLACDEEARDWRRFGRAQLARACGDDEPDYTEADPKREPRA